MIFPENQPMSVFSSLCQSFVQLGNCKMEVRWSLQLDGRSASVCLSKKRRQKSSASWPGNQVWSAGESGGGGTGGRGGGGGWQRSMGDEL